jgi:probable phosphoglycerate mutase
VEALRDLQKQIPVYMGMGMAVEVFLLRHGETVWNTERRLQGEHDSPLTCRGREQAHLLGRILAKHLGPRHQVPMYVSPLGRTRATAVIVQQHAESSRVISEPRIKEVSLGAWEGLTRAEVDARWPGLTDGLASPEWFFRAPGAERYADFEQRIRAWLEEQNGSVIAVSHGVAGRIIRGLYLGLSREQTLALTVPQDIVWRLAGGEIAALSAC